MLLLCLLLLITGHALAAQVAQENMSIVSKEIVAGNAYIPKGTVLRGVLQNTIDSATCNVGDTFSFKLLHNVIIGNVMIIPKDTIGQGIVKSIKRAGAFGKGGKIELEAVNIQTLSGINVPLSLGLQQKGGGHQADLSWYDSNTSSATPSLTIGAMSGLANGANVQLGAGTKLNITIPVNVDLQATLVELARKIMEDGGKKKASETTVSSDSDKS
ncbi:MAG: hypothetical protein H6Q69_1964 [Firmicutes bacterium]|nr:hypothetical protein [Bacillota bacterium]